MFSGIRYDYGQIIELNENVEPDLFTYKSTRQKCECICQVVLGSVCFVTSYGLIFGMGYGYGIAKHSCDGSD